MKDKELWQLEAIKLGGESLVQVIEEIRDGQNLMLERQEQMDERLTDISNAFPAGDIDGHKRYHEAIIRSYEERRRLRIAIQEKTISGLFWVVVLGTGTCIVNEIKRRLGIDR